MYVMYVVCMSLFLFLFLQFPERGQAISEIRRDCTPVLLGITRVGRKIGRGEERETEEKELVHRIENRDSK